MTHHWRRSSSWYNFSTPVHEKCNQLETKRNFFSSLHCKEILKPKENVLPALLFEFFGCPHPHVKGMCAVRSDPDCVCSPHSSFLGTPPTPTTTSPPATVAACFLRTSSASPLPRSPPVLVLTCLYNPASFFPARIPCPTLHSSPS